MKQYKEFQLLQVLLALLLVVKSFSPLYFNYLSSDLPTDALSSGRGVFVCSSLGFRYVLPDSGEDNGGHRSVSQYDCPLCSVRDDGVDAAIVPASHAALPDKTPIKLFIKPDTKQRPSVPLRYDHYIAQAPPANALT